MPLPARVNRAPLVPPRPAAARRAWRGALLLLLLAPALLPAAQAQDVIAPTGQWVTDRAGLLGPGEREALSRKLAAYADTTSTQVVVVILPTLDGADPAMYATELGQRWGVGQGETDNGAVVLVVPQEREVFIATGYGLEGSIPDIVAARIVRNVIVPAFRQGQYYAGLDAAVDALIAAARGEYQAEPRGAPGDGGADFTLLFILLIIIVVVLSNARKGGGGRGGRRRGWGGPGVIFLPGGFGGGGFGGGGFGGGGFGGFGGGGGGFGGGGAGGSW